MVDIKITYPGIYFNGFPVILDKYMTENVWEFPYDKYIEYGNEDLWWAIPWGFGKFVEKPKSEIMKVGNQLVMHPEMWDKLKTEIDRRNEPISKMMVPEPYSPLLTW